MKNVALNASIDHTLVPFVQSDMTIKPFLKWAGGKTQILTSLMGLLPRDYNNYIEPFVGAGALFFSVKPRLGIISDLNYELIITYRAIQADVESVIESLLTLKPDEKTYYQVRSIDPETLSFPYRAARMIYLNKTCYNGLYRVNKRGFFNVPYGKRSMVSYNLDNIRKASLLLKSTKVLHGDYLSVLQEHAEFGDLVFLDPPYHPVSKYSDFKRYTKEFFYEEDQIKLKQEFCRLVDLGCHVILANSDHPFITDLFKDYQTIRLDTKRLINCDANKRNGVDLIVLGNL